MPIIQAKRMAPNPVEPIYFEGIRYEVSDMGVVLAWDEKNNQELWKNTIYNVSYNSTIEKDVQDVWITKLEVVNGFLLVTNERDAIYKVDLKRGNVLSSENISIGPFGSSKINSALTIGGFIFLIILGFISYRFFIRR